MPPRKRGRPSPEEEEEEEDHMVGHQAKRARPSRQPQQVKREPEGGQQRPAAPCGEVEVIDLCSPSEDEEAQAHALERGNKGGLVRTQAGRKRTHARAHAYACACMLAHSMHALLWHMHARSLIRTCALILSPVAVHS